MERKFDIVLLDEVPTSQQSLNVTFIKCTFQLPVYRWLFTRLIFRKSRPSRELSASA